MTRVNQYVEAFLLGNTAILTNVCLLPLYPGLVAFLIGRITDGSTRRASRWLGVIVLAGILTMMLLVGFVLYLVQASFGSVLSVLLPVIYGIVIVFGLLMMVGRNPFSRITMLQVPVLKNPYATAYLYGLFLGPMTLPCTGPLITSAFVLGAGNLLQLTDGLLYFLFFGLGFGWPLVVLPFVAMRVQRQFTSWLTAHHTLLNRLSGLLLVIIGVFGIWTEVIPNV
jgi:cytochrome c-type biogenesis protein